MKRKIFSNHKSYIEPLFLDVHAFQILFIYFINPFCPIISNDSSHHLISRSRPCQTQTLYSTDLTIRYPLPSPIPSDIQQVTMPNIKIKSSHTYSSPHIKRTLSLNPPSRSHNNIGNRYIDFSLLPPSQKRSWNRFTGASWPRARRRRGRESLTVRMRMTVMQTPGTVMATSMVQVWARGCGTCGEEDGKEKEDGMHHSLSGRDMGRPRGWCLVSRYRCYCRWVIFWKAEETSFSLGEKASRLGK